MNAKTMPLSTLTPAERAQRMQGLATAAMHSAIVLKHRSVGEPYPAAPLASALADLRKAVQCLEHAAARQTTLASRQTEPAQ